MPIPRPTSDNYEYPSDSGIMGEDYEHDQSRFKEVTDEELKAFKKKKEDATPMEGMRGEFLGENEPQGSGTMTDEELKAFKKKKEDE